MNFIEQKNYDINSNDSKNFCIENQSNDFLSKYYILINQYIAFYIENIYENININNDKRYRYYILLKGLDTLSSIMNIIILHTNNIDLAFYYCNKAYYYYIEFISQIDTDNNHLELTVKDAIIFVYKKTIFEIKEPLSSLNNSNVNKENLIKLTTIERMINVVNTYFKIFKFTDIINLNINNNISDTINSNINDNINNNINKTEYFNNHVSIDKNFLKMISKIDKLYINEEQFNNIVTNLDNILNQVLKTYNRLNIIDSTVYEYDINLNLLMQLIDKIITKIGDNKNTISYDNIITLDLITNLTNAKIRQTLAIIPN